MAVSDAYSIIAEVAAPAGAGLAVLGLIFSQIIKSGRIGGLTPDHRYSIARQIVWASTIVALASIAAFALGSKMAEPTPSPSPTPKTTPQPPNPPLPPVSVPPVVVRRPPENPTPPDYNPYANLPLEQLKSQSDTAYDEGQFTRAYSLNAEACRRKSAISCYWNGYLKENGMGFAVNADLALKWYSRGCALGYQESCDRKTHLQTQ